MLEDFDLSVKTPLTTPTQQKTPEEIEEDKVIEKYRQELRSQEGPITGSLLNTARTATNSLYWGAPDLAMIAGYAATGNADKALEYVRRQKARELEYPISTAVGEYGIPIALSLFSLGETAAGAVGAQAAKAAARTAAKELAESVGKKVAVKGAKTSLGRELSEKVAKETLEEIAKKSVATRAAFTGKGLVESQIDDLVFAAERRAIQQLAAQPIRKRGVREAVKKAREVTTSVYKWTPFGAADRLSQRFVRDRTARLESIFLGDQATRASMNVVRRLAGEFAVRVPTRVAATTVIDMPLYTLGKGVREGILAMDPSVAGEYMYSNIAPMMVSGAEVGGFFGLAEATLPTALRGLGKALKVGIENIPFIGRKPLAKLWTSADAQSKTGIATTTAQLLFDNKEEVVAAARFWPEAQLGSLVEILGSSTPETANFIIKNVKQIVSATQRFGKEKAAGFIRSIINLDDSQKAWMIENAEDLSQLDRKIPGFYQAIRKTFETDHGVWASTAADELMLAAKDSIVDPATMSSKIASMFSRKKAQVIAADELISKAYPRLSADEINIFRSAGKPGGPPSTSAIVKSAFDLHEDASMLVSDALRNPLQYGKGVVRELQSNVSTFESTVISILGKDPRRARQPLPASDILGLPGVPREAAEASVAQAVERNRLASIAKKVEEEIRLGKSPGTPTLPEHLYDYYLKVERETAFDYIPPRFGREMRIAAESKPPRKPFDSVIGMKFSPDPRQAFLNVDRPAAAQLAEKEELIAALRAIRADEEYLRTGFVSQSIKNKLKAQGMADEEIEQIAEEAYRKARTRFLEKGIQEKPLKTLEETVQEERSLETREVREAFPPSPEFNDPYRPSWTHPSQKARDYEQSLFDTIVSRPDVPKQSIVDEVVDFIARRDQLAREQAEIAAAGYPAYVIPDVTAEQARDISRAMRNFRTAVGDTISQGRQSTFGVKPNFTKRYVNATGLAESVYRLAKTTLTDESVFGRAAAARHDIDTVFSEYMRLTGGSGAFRKNFMTQGSTSIGGKRVASAVSEKKVAAFVKQLGSLVAKEADNATKSALEPFEKLLEKDLMKNPEMLPAHAWHEMDKVVTSMEQLVRKHLPDIIESPYAKDAGLLSKLVETPMASANNLTRQKLAKSFSEKSTNQFLESLMRMTADVSEETTQTARQLSNKNVVEQAIKNLGTQADPDFLLRTGVGQVAKDLPSIARDVSKLFPRFGSGGFSTIGRTLSVLNTIARLVEYRWQVAPHLKSMVETDIFLKKYGDGFQSMTKTAIDSWRRQQLISNAAGPANLRIPTPGAEPVTPEEIELKRTFDEQERIDRELREAGLSDESIAPAAPDSADEEAQPVSDEDKELQRIYREDERITKELQEAEHTSIILNRARDISGNPSKAFEAMEEAGGEVMGDLPDTMSAASMTMTRVANEIAQIVPARPVGLLEKEILTQDQISRINRTVEIASNPAIVIKRVYDGSLTQQDVDSLTRMMPNASQQIRMEVYNMMQACAEQGISIPFASKCAAERLIGVPIAATTSSAVARSAQGVYSQGRQNGPGRPRQTMTPAMVDNRSSGRVYGASNLGVANRLLTDKQRSETRNA